MCSRRTLVAAIFLFASLAGCSELLPFTSGGSGKMTPEMARQKGTLLRIVNIGDYSIEMRTYQEGSSTNSARFCDYWVSYKGNRVNELIGVYLNYYNSCNALLQIKHADYAFVLSAYAGSGGDYVPVFFGSRDGLMLWRRRPECGLNSHREGYAQIRDGWTVINGQATICGTAWAVMSDGP